MSRESILNIAINYPEALGYLVQYGISPDRQNDFGKTPLMYAAQYNQVESAKLLLAHGANVNASTVRPSDTCYYTLSTFNMTPLHYAVRYASPELIELLLDNGAQPFIKAKNARQYPEAEETPLDWLRRYTAVDAEERNPNITDEQVADIEHKLLPLTPEQMANRSDEYVLKAESSYRNADVTQAYREIALAYQLQPDNKRALLDLSLLALKAGHLGESLSASDKLIYGNADDKTKASAWFNYGLACEKYKSDGGSGWIDYNGAHYCTYGVLYPYVKAYESAPSSARGNKIKSLFDKHAVPYCEISSGRESIKINFQMGADPDSKKRRHQLQTIYVLHGKAEQISGVELAWDVRFYGGEAKHVVPEKVLSINVDDSVMSVYETPITYVRFPYAVLGSVCERDESMKLPKVE